MAHILAIDDDPGILALIEHALRREGHTITCMPHVPADLAAHLAEYDLILLDVMMPQTDGYELCSAIRDDTDCPILFLTAKTMEEDVDYGFSVGADDYIKKPFSIVELRARVAAHLRREQREKHHCLSIQGIRFLLASREVAAGGVTLPFTRTEYEITLLLAKNRGQTFSREQIYEAVLGYDKTGDASAITEHIKNIRKKFAAVNMAPIQTGMGDRLSMERMKKKKKEIRLRTFFVRFLLKLVAAVLLAFLLWLLQITVSVGTGLILPADAAEKEALAYLHTIGAHTDIVSSGIPSACGYAIYDASGELLETDMSGSIRENADLLALSGQDSLSANMLGRTYVKRQTDTRIVVLTYDFRSAFANPTLRRLFPSAELLELFHLQEAADEIRNQNLDFTIRPTAICEFNQVAASLDALKSELSASLKEQWHMQQQRRRQFSALAHDIKTPLTIVRGNAELLSETALDPTQQTCNRFILENAAQIQDYLSRIIELAKTDDPAACSAECRFQAQLHTASFFDDLLGNTKSLGQKKELHVLFSTETLPAVLPLPEHPLRRILNNLLDNAVCYSPHKGTVTLDAAIRDYRDAPEKESTLFLTVSDEGPGFCEDALLYGTEAFYRESADRNDKSHFGLGLSIADQLARGLGGSIALCNAPAGGAVVIVRLPLTGQIQRDAE